MRSEDLGLVSTSPVCTTKSLFGCIQLYFSPQIADHQLVRFFPPDPPNVVFHLETVTMRPQVSHRNASLLLRWRDDASQVICTSYHVSLDGAQLSCLILCHLLQVFLYFAKGPFRGFYFSPENAFVFLTLSTHQCEKPASSFHACNQCHCSISFAPITLWLAIRAVARPVLLLAFQLLLFLGRNVPTFLV